MTIAKHNHKYRFAFGLQSVTVWASDYMLAQRQAKAEIAKRAWARNKPRPTDVDLLLVVTSDPAWMNALAANSVEAPAE